MIEVGMKVMFKEEILEGYQVAFAKKVERREGIVESVYTPAGIGKPRARVRVRWLKRGNRGKEFVEHHYPGDLRPA